VLVLLHGLLVIDHRKVQYRSSQTWDEEDDRTI
jgi:hypothetical protein